MLNPSPSEKIYTSIKVAALLKSLIAEGVWDKQALTSLRSTNWNVGELPHADAKFELDQSVPAMQPPA